eukprot:PhM_4_TR11985/c0_g1_i1/m.13147
MAAFQLRPHYLLVALFLVTMMCRSFLIGSTSTSDGNKTAAITVVGAQATVQQHARVTDGSAPTAALSRASKAPRRFRRVILSCLYAMPSFYRSGRSMPSFDWVVVFFNSAAAHVPSTRVVLFVDVKTRSALRRYPDVVDLEASGVLELPLMPEALLALPIAHNISNAANNFRFAAFRDWIAQAERSPDEDAPDHVMISDVTDVYFQADPFTAFASKGQTITFTLEDGSRNLGEKYNSKWLSCYGRDVQHSLRKQRISCAGLTIGETATMRRYAEMQVQELSKPDLLECSRHRILAALDQATHNYILHTRASKELPGSGTSDDIVFHGNFKKPRWDPSGTVLLRSDGHPYPAVHQYTSNRHPDVMKIAKQRFLKRGKQ